MNRIIPSVCLILTSASLLYSQSSLPPVDFDMPEIPMIPEDSAPTTKKPSLPPQPPAQPSARPSSKSSAKPSIPMPPLPGSASSSGKKASSSLPPLPPLPSSKTSKKTSKESSTSGSSTELPQATSVTVTPEAPRSIQGTPVVDWASIFTNHYKMEVIFSSKPWSQYWNSPKLGIMHVTSMPYTYPAPSGGILSWQRDDLGNPMIYLRAKLNFPRLLPLIRTSDQREVKTAHVEIAQAVVFYQRAGSCATGWMASASPIYVTLKDGKKNLVLVPVKRGQGAWKAPVGPGGLYIENFVGAGLMAARTELARYFDTEELNMFLRGNSDVIFYLCNQAPQFQKISRPLMPGN